MKSLPPSTLIVGPVLLLHPIRSHEVLVTPPVEDFLHSKLESIFPAHLLPSFFLSHPL